MVGPEKLKQKFSYKQQALWS